MEAEQPPDFIVRADGVRLAYRYVEGKGPTLVFLPGYASDMLGGKAVALSAWAAQNGHAILRLDYSGCGESEGKFESGTLDMWRDDALNVIEQCAPGPLMLIGSSMGGWLALMVAEKLGPRVTALVGIAAAPDFTQWGFGAEEKAKIERDGRLERHTDYGPEPMVTMRGFWQSGQANLMLHREIAVDCPVRLLQGQCDDAVPWETALTIAAKLRSDDVQVTLIKDGDHRLSRYEDIALLIATVKDLLDKP